MKGIDIFCQTGNGHVDFNALKVAGIEVIYIKATEGVTYTDANSESHVTYKDFYNRAKAAGFKVGFYHFLRTNNPVAEAQHFLNAVAGLQVDCKYMIDCEVTLNQSAQQIQSNVMQFANFLKSKGLDVGLYTYSAFFKENNLQVVNLPLWIAEYGVSRPNVNVPYAGFQYSETGCISGINDHVDLDEFGDGMLIGNNSTEVAPVQAQSGNDTIKTIQMQLNTLLKKGLAVDGLEGPATNTAIREFQGSMGLAIDGIWGPKTAEAIGQIYSRPLDGVPEPHYEYATRYIQYRVGGIIDGVFGNGTKINVQNWQARHGLGADGIVGAATWSKMLDENC